MLNIQPCNKLHFKIYAKNRKCNNSQYYGFYCMIDKIHAAFIVETSFKNIFTFTFL